MQKFKKADREKFMSDWRKCLPALRVQRSMSLLKRNGPILVGVHLQENRGNEYYFVVPHIHSLIRRTSSVSLTLAYALRNKRNTYKDMFTLKSHDREIADACTRLHSQTLFPLDEKLSLSEIVYAYDISIKRNLVLDSREKLYEDILSFLTWCGKTVEAERRLAEYIQIMSTWEDKIFDREGGKTVVFDRLVAITENPDRLRKIYEEQVKLLKVDKLPDYGLVCD